MRGVSGVSGVSSVSGKGGGGSSRIGRTVLEQQHDLLALELAVRFLAVVEDLPARDAEGPHVRLVREFAVVDALERIPEWVGGVSGRVSQSVSQSASQPVSQSVSGASDWVERVE